MSENEDSTENLGALLGSPIFISLDVLVDVWVPDQLLVAVDRNHSIADIIESAPLRELEWSGSKSK